MDKRILMVILDGIGDRPVEELAGKTSLQAAETPNLDSFAKNGVNGIMDTIAPGIIPGSDTGHLALLGYDPYKVYTGRGPFEAAGIGLELEKGDIAFRCNFATLQDGKIIDRRAGRIKEGTQDLAKTINDIDLGIDFYFKESVEHRGVLIFKEKRLGSQVTDVDPHREGDEYHKAEPIVENKENKRTAEILNKFTERSHEVLYNHPINRKRTKNKKHPANIILARGAGEVPDIMPMQQKYGIKGAAIAGISLVKGVCRLVGMDIIEVKGATGGLDTNVENIIKASKKALDENDLVLVNIKGCDLLGHDGLAQEKKEFIEHIDSIIDILKDIKDTYCVITGDHSTPVSVKDHSGDPLPVTICGENVRIDNVERFDEISCAYGGLGRFKGRDLFNIMLDLADKSEKFGA